MGQYRGVELDPVRLDGPRLTLRSWRRTDADQVTEIMADRSMHEFLALPDPYTVEDARQFIREVGIRGRAEGRALHNAVTERSTGRLIGSATLHLGGDPEVGYWIAPTARGSGYAAEAAGLLAGWAFGIGVRRVRLLCDVRNLASSRTALAAGFRFEGVARDGVAGGGVGGIPERRADLAMFARLPADPAERIAPAFAALPADGLSDGVLQLRATRPGDAPQLAELDDELTLRWSFTGEPHSADEVARAAARAGLDWLVGAKAAFTLVDVATGRVAGSLDLRHAGPPQVGGIGYIVHPAFRGRGYTARALRLLVPWAFDVADFARLELGAKPGNAASLRAAASAGFQPDGTRERRMRNPDGTFTDETRYVLINPKYR